MIGEMSVQEVKNALDNNEDIVLVDCREQAEWDDGHVEQAIFIPLSDIENQSSKLTNPNAKVAIMCRSGKRSLAACQFFEEEKDFTSLFNVTGGILAWEAEEFPTTK